MCAFIKNLDFKYMNLKKAYTKLEEAAQLYDGENEIVRDSLIQRFQFVYELCHKTLFEFMGHMGVTLANSFPRTIFKKSYVNNLLSDETVWLNLLEDRSRTSHVYNQKLAETIALRIKNEYVSAIGELIKTIDALY